jgi:hypothetical protein
LRVNQQKPRKEMWRQQHKGRGREKKKVRITKKKTSLKGFYHYRRAEERGGLRRRETNC